jgi:two-component system CheB/CheR fusion protein
VLSGTGSEGTLGLRAIKEKGGLVLVQDPKTTRYDGMPGSAISTGVVDYVLPPDKMPGQILRYLKHTDARPLKPAVITETTLGDPLKKIIFLIRSKNGHDFSLYKQNTLVRRIEKRMAILQIGSKADYAAFLRSNPQEIDLLFRELLIRVTNFFRDGEAYEIVKEKAFPLLFKDLLDRRRGLFRSHHRSGVHRHAEAEIQRADFRHRYRQRRHRYGTHRALPRRHFGRCVA